MTTQVPPPLCSFADWIRATDPHAAHRLPLLEESSRLLANRNGHTPAARPALAARLERWRYQFLNQHGGRMAAEDWQFAAALDLAANAFAGGAPRPARATRLAIQDASSDDAMPAEARRALVPDVPLESVVARAAALTQEQFGAARPASRFGRGGGGEGGEECKVQNAKCKMQNGGGTVSHAGEASRWRMLLYAPIYLSNYCVNHCRYCGFRHPQAIARRHLRPDEALREADVLCGRGFRHILLVAGEFPRLTTPRYFAGIIAALRARGVAAAIEIAPQSTESYALLAAAGATGVTLYQETYDERLYAEYHPRGSKASYDWRLEGLDRAAEAGMARLGLGFLLGLADPRQDLAALMRHGRYLAARFSDRSLAFSLPRIHDAPDGFRVRFPVDDETFVRMYCALRLAFPRAELVLSTREPEALRNRLCTICITQLSAGSCTAPGGYEDASASRAGEQFPVCDRRSPAEVAAWLRAAGFEVAWEITA